MKPFQCTHEGLQGGACSQWCGREACASVMRFVEMPKTIRAALLAFHARPCDPEATAVVRAVLAAFGTAPPTEQQLADYVKGAHALQREVLAGEEPAAWERRQGMRLGGGDWRWYAWQPCTEAEARRVTGLHSWQVRRTGKCRACGGTGVVPVQGEGAAHV